MTVGDVIRRALREIGALSKNEPPSADEMNDGLEALNDMLGLWSARKIIVRGMTLENFPLTAAVPSYTIGPTGVFATPKPYRVTSGYIRDTNLVDTPLEIVRVDEYDSYEDKAISSARPWALAYDPGAAQQAAQLGTLFLYPTPDASTTYRLYIESQKAFANFANIAATVTFEEAYSEALKYNLAIRLYREYHEHMKPIPTDLIVLAKEGMCAIEKLNAEQVHSVIEVPGKKAIFNVYTGDYH
jgi:hypothetical protein